MPLDGHAFLLNQGWSGTGTGLRTGAISRPITAPQKKNLAGVGKDRDEAFPFWDHLYTVAASAVQIECFSSDDEEGPQSDTKDTRSSTVELRQTSTGILSNRPPIVGTPVSSGATTPTLCLDGTPGPSTLRPSLLSLAKREAARRGLYSRFFRGPVLGPDDVQAEMVKSESVTTPEIEKGPKKKRKIDACGEDAPRDDGDDASKEVRKREKRRLKEAERAARKLKRRKERKDGVILSQEQEQASGPLGSTILNELHHARREKKKKKRFKAASVDVELDAQSSVSADERTLEGEHREGSRKKDSSKSSRKRRGRDRSL